METKPGIAVLLVATLCPGLQAQAPPAPQTPLTEKEVTQLIKKNKKNPERVTAVLQERGVDFDLNPELEKKLRKAGAENPLLEAIWKAGPTARALQTQFTSMTGEQLQVSPEEAKEYGVVQRELDPDRQLALGSEFEKKFPDSLLLPYVYSNAARVHQARGDLEKTAEYAEKALKLDPNNLVSLLLAAMVLPQPRMLRRAGAEKGKGLSDAEQYATRAITLISVLTRQPNDTEEAYQQRKNDLAADAHFALGMIHLGRDDYAKAAEEFSNSISLSATPNPQSYFRLGEALESQGKNPEALGAFTKASQLGEGTPFKTFADRKIEEIKSKK